MFGNGRVALNCDFLLLIERKEMFFSAHTSHSFTSQNTQFNTRQNLHKHIFTYAVCKLVHDKWTRAQIGNPDPGFAQYRQNKSNGHGSIICHFSALPLNPRLGPCGTKSVTSALLTIAIIQF